MTSIKETGQPPEENFLLKYNFCLIDFINRNNLKEVELPGVGKGFCYPEREPILTPNYREHFSIDSLDQENVLRLSTPDFIKAYFETKDYRIVESKELVNPKGTTLFICAGVQVLDNVIHNDDKVPEGKLFVAQPVLRTQFMDQIKEGISTSFVNIATEIVNPSVDEHFKALEEWLNFLQLLGLQRSNFFFLLTQKDRKWGDKKLKSQDFRIRYNGFSLGSAIFLYDIPKKQRQNLQISDIGFGLERLRWMLGGGSYTDHLIPGQKLSNFDDQVLDYARTLALLAGSGVIPSNNEQGYRFRKFSKLLVARNISCHHDLQFLLESFYNYWERWAKLEVSLEESLERIRKENERNFNRELINRLIRTYPDVGIDINLPTKDVIKALKGTSVELEVLKKILEEIEWG